MKSFIRAVSASNKDLRDLRIEEVIVKHTVDEKEKKITINITFEEGKEKVMYLVEDYNGLSLMNTSDLQQALSRYGAITVPIPLTTE